MGSNGSWHKSSNDKAKETKEPNGICILEIIIPAKMTWMKLLNKYAKLVILSSEPLSINTVNILFRFKK